MGVGVQLNKHDKLGYTFRGKKAFPISYDGLLGINVKGMYDVDKDLRKVSIIDAAYYYILIRSMSKFTFFCTHTVSFFIIFLFIVYILIIRLFILVILWIMFLSCYYWDLIISYGI